MNVITPITFTNQSVTVEAGQTYQLVDNQGQPLKKFGVEAQDDTLTVKLQDEGITLKIQQYQQANFVAPQDAQISGDAQLISLFETGDTAIAEQIATNFSPTILWWTIGSVLTLSTGMLLFGRKKSKPTAPLAPKNEASLADITDDNTLNFSESQTQITVRGTLKNVPENATLKLLLDANPLDIEIIRNGEQFSAEISGERLSHGQQLSLQVHNEKGELLTQAEKNYRVKLSTSDTLTLKIADITDDNTINNNESQNKVQLKINVSGLDNDAQGTLTILDGDMALGQREVTDNGEMLFQIDGNKLTTGNVKAVLNVKDEVANTNSADKLHPYSIDTAITPPTITIDQVANQNTITRQDLRNPQLPIELTISNLDADSQATLRLYNNQQLIGTAPVKQNGKLTVNVNGANIIAEQIEAVIDAQDNAHNQIQSRTHKTITLNTHFPQAEVQIISIADNGVINQAKTETTQNVVLAIRGITPETSNRVVLKDGNQELTSQTVAQNGELRLTVAGEQLTSGQLRAEIYTTYQGETLSREDNKTYTLDTKITQPTVEVRSIAGDNVITKAEQANPIEVKVNVGNLTDTDLKTKTVSLYQDNELLGSQNAVNGENIFRIPANKLNGGSLVAKIKVADNADNLAESQSNPTAYTVKNSVAVPSVAIENIADNNIINLAKSKLAQDVVLNVTNLETGATARVELSQNGTLLASREAISANGKITLSVPANSLKTNSLSAKIIATDKYSQTAEATSKLFNFTLDTDIQTPTVTLGDIATNNLINQANSQTTHNLTVTVAGLPNGSHTTVELLDGAGKQLSAPQTFNSNGDKTFPIAQNTLTQGDGQIIAKYHTVSASGNEATLNSKAKAYTLDTQITTPTVEVRSIAGDNVITKAEQNSAIEVKVNVGNLTDTDLKTKTVLLYQDNELLGSQNAVNGENTFRIPANKLNGGSLVAKINVADNAGNLAESQSNPTAYTVKNSVAVPTVAIEKISDNNLINLAKSKLVQEVVVNISNLETGATARVELSQNGTLLASREAISANGKITLSVPANSLKTNSLSAKIIATDKYSQTAEATSKLFNFTLDTDIQTPTVTLGDIATNNLINQANSQTTHNLTVTVAGLPNGSRTTVELLDGAGKQLSAAQTFNSNGDKTFPIAQSALTQGKGQIIAKYHTVSASGNEATLNSEEKAYTLDTQITTPTVEVRSIAGDNVITKAEQNSAIEVKVNVGNLTDTDLKTKTVSLYQDNELLGSQNAVNGENTFRIPANKLNGGSLVAKIKVADNADNLAESQSNPTAYTVKNSVAVPTVAIVSVAGSAVNNGNVDDILSPRNVSAETVPVVLNVNGLEAEGKGTLTLNLNGVTKATSAINANGQVTLLLNKTDLIGAQTKVLTANLSAQDKYLNPAVNAEAVSANYQTDFQINRPTVEILTIGGETQYELYEHQVSQAQIPVKLKVSNLDSDASGQITLKIGDATVGTLDVQENSDDLIINVSGEQLRAGNAITAGFTASDTVGNRATSTDDIQNYDVDNYIRIKTVNANFNISYTDTRQAGVEISGKIVLDAELQDNWKNRPNTVINKGDTWRWIESVTVEFENGKTYSVPVTHTDPDNDAFTEDPNEVYYNLALTASQWNEVSGQAFRIIPNRLKYRDGSNATVQFYLNNPLNDGIYRESDAIFKPLKIDIQPDENNDIVSSGKTDFPHRLKALDPKIWITGEAGGNDVQVGDKVTITIGNYQHETHLLEGKIFRIQVDSRELLDNSDLAVQASLTTKVGVPVKPDRATYFSSAITPETNESDHTSSQTTTGVVELNRLPYFINTLLFAEDHRFGYLRGKTTGEGLTIKYAFADPAQAHTKEYLKKYANHSDPKLHTDLLAFSESNKVEIVKALAQFSSYTKLNFELVEGGMVDGKEGINFFIYPFTPSALGYAFEGGDVFLNSTKFQNAGDTGHDSIVPSNQGFTTILHEVMHSLGLKHPHDQDTDDHHHEEEDEHEHDSRVLSGIEDSTMLTLMSYKWDINDFSTNLRMYDLATLHYRYGVNANARKTDDLYSFKTFNPKSPDGDIYIWDGAGNDTFNASNANDKVYINLKPGSWIYIGQRADKFAISNKNTFTESDYFNDRNFTHTSNYLQNMFNTLHPTYTLNDTQAFIGYGTVIENAVGTAFDDTLIGNDVDNRLEGGKGNDRLEGLNGNDVLNGDEGNDTMIGGNGNDAYFVDSQQDVVTEEKNGGTDTVYSTISLTQAPSNVEIFRLLGTEELSIDATGTDDAVRIYGNKGNNLLVGGRGNDLLDGSEGADVLRGGEGDDVYYIDHPDDHIEENERAGKDTVYSSINVVGVDKNVEIIRLIGNDNLNIDASTFKNTTAEAGLGNSRTQINNVSVELYGNNGNNEIIGGIRNDILDGGEGADKLYGGGGDDTYYLNTLEDRAIELNREGYDTVYTKNSYTLGKEDYIEKVVLMEESNAQMITASLAEDDYLKQYSGNYTNVTKFGQIVKEEINFTAVGNNHANIFDITIARSLHNAHSSVKPIGIIEGKEGNDRFILTLEMQDNGHPANLTNKPELSLFSSLEARVENGTLHIHGISAPQSPHQTFDVIDVNSNNKLFEGTITDGTYTDTIPLERLGENPRLRFSPTGKGDVMSIGSAEVSVSGDIAEVSYNHLREVSLEDHPAFVLKDFEAGKDQLSFNFKLNNNTQSKDLFSVKEDTLYFERENTEYNYSYKLALVKFENGIPTNLLEII